MESAVRDRTKILLRVLALVTIAWLIPWPYRWPPWDQIRHLAAFRPVVPRPAAQIPAPSPAVRPSVPSPTMQSHPRCTSVQGPTAPGAQVPTPGSTDKDGKPIGLGRGYLEGSHPSYSPDGREVAFVRYLDSNRIWISSVDGKSLRQLTTDRDPDPGSQTIDGSPAWSPDGSRIAFESSGHIWLISPDGSNLTQLTTDPAGNKSPAWSPDGSKIAFISNRGGSEDIWIMDADGTNPMRVTTGSVGSFSNPAFSPDGSQIVFSSPLGPNVANLMIINTDGTGLCQVTAGKFEDRHPHWSTRGIVFSRLESGHLGLWLIQPDGSGPEALRGTDGGTRPVWSPDASKIAFDDSSNIYVFDLAKRTVKPLTQLNVLSIVIYIKPGVANTINPKSERSIPVAILSAPWFDPVRQIDQSSITFGPTGTERSPTSCIQDEVNEDRVPDLVCQFDVAAAFSRAHTEGILKAKDADGLLFEGRDAVKVLY